MVGGLQCVVIHVKCDPNPFKGYGAVGVENGPFLLLWPVAYSTACTTVQVHAYSASEIPFALIQLLHGYAYVPQVVSPSATTVQLLRFATASNTKYVHTSLSDRRPQPLFILFCIFSFSHNLLEKIMTLAITTNNKLTLPRFRDQCF